MLTRRLLVFILIVLIITAISAPAAANFPDAAPGHLPQESGGIIDMLIAGMFNGITAALLATDMIPLGTLLYGDNLPITEEHHRRWLFLGDWKAPAMPAYGAFGFVAYALMLITITSAGIKMGLTTWLSPSARANVAQMIFNWVVAALLLVSLPSFFGLLIQLNDALVDVAFGLAGGNAPGAVPALLANEFRVDTGNLLLSSIINLALAAFIVYFNVMFMLRWFIVIALFSVSPLVIWAWAKGQTTAFFLWLGECISNVLTQFVYALVFALVIGIILVPANPATGVPWWMYLVIMLTIIPLGTLLRRLITQWLNIIGLDEEGTSSRVVGSGVGSLMAVGGALAGARGNAQRPSYAGGGQGPGGAPVPSYGRGGSGQGAPAAPATGIKGKLAGVAGIAGNVLKTGTALTAGAVVGLGTAPVLGSQGIAMGAGVTKSISGFGRPGSIPRQQGNNQGTNNYSQGQRNNQGTSSSQGQGNNQGTGSQSAYTTSGAHMSSTSSYPGTQGGHSAMSGNPPPVGSNPQQSPRGGRNAPAPGQMNIWDFMPPP